MKTEYKTWAEPLKKLKSKTIKFVAKVTPSTSLRPLSLILIFSLYISFIFFSLPKDLLSLCQHMQGHHSPGLKYSLC